ncbi:MAG: 4-hydroxyphenylpyruvate dioxygenase, partial [Alphaproteobacteria bacterium]
MNVQTAGASRDLFENPLGTDGFEFVEFTSPEPGRLKGLFERM